MGGLPPDCTLRDTGPKEAKGVTTSAATRLMGIRGRQRGEGPSAGTQTSEEDPHLAQNPWLPHPAPLASSPATPRGGMAPQPAPGLASFQLGQIAGKTREPCCGKRLRSEERVPEAHPQFSK